MEADSLPDPLDAEIAAVRRVMMDARRVIEIQGAVLASLERVKAARDGVKPNGAAALDPVQLSAPAMGALNAHASASRRGKQPGAISNQWRDTMGKIVADGNHLMTPDLWSVAASECNYTIDAETARDWLRRAAKTTFGYIERQGDAFRVSQAAIQRFKLKAPEPPPEVTSDGSA